VGSFSKSLNRNKFILEKMIDKVLKEIGLTQNEIKVYLALLDLGEAKTGEILKNSGLNSGRIYEILDSLQKKGLVSFVLKSGVKLFSPADPKRVKDYLKEKKDAIEKQEKDFDQILPELLGKISMTKSPSKIEVFTGFKGMKTAWRREFDHSDKETLYVIGINSSANYSKDVWNYFANIHRKKRENHGFKVRKLLSKEARFEREAHEKKAKVRYLPYGSLVPMSIIGNLTLIGIMTEQSITIAIESEEVARNFREQFKVLWKAAEE
jgi:sugar-specific transcriptional regulator TrmB